MGNNDLIFFGIFGMLSAICLYFGFKASRCSDGKKHIYKREGSSMTFGTGCNKFTELFDTYTCVKCGRYYSE